MEDIYIKIEEERVGEWEGKLKSERGREKKMKERGRESGRVNWKKQREIKKERDMGKVNWKRERDKEREKKRER